jgi:hypothetical protein
MMEVAWGDRWSGVVVPSTKYLIKGGTFRAYVKQLEEGKTLEVVLRRVSPEAATLARNPPLKSSWVDAHKLTELVEAVYALQGREGVLQLGRDVVQKQMLPFFLPMLRGIMRVVGVSPAALLSRYQSILKPIVQGQEFRYEPTSPRSGIMEIRYDTDVTLHWGVFAQNIAGFECIFRVCGVEGTVDEFEILGPQQARFPLSW